MLLWMDFEKLMPFPVNVLSLALSLSHHDKDRQNCDALDGYKCCNSEIY